MAKFLSIIPTVTFFFHCELAGPKNKNKLSKALLLNRLKEKQYYQTFMQRFSLELNFWPLPHLLRPMIPIALKEPGYLSGSLMVLEPAIEFVNKAKRMANLRMMLWNCILVLLIDWE